MHKIPAEDWRTVFGLLDTALELPVAARAAWLASLAGTPAPVVDALRELLARETSDGFLRQLPQFTATPEMHSHAALADSAAAGGTVGPYRLIHRLGRGGMSSVWVAERIDASPRRHVALKLPHVTWALPELTRRMARERDILASLEHPNIARLYDAGLADDGRPYLALELVDGLPVDEYCDRCSADIATRVALTQQVARAVAYAHSRSVVHRDLKPSNIMVDAAGQVRLLDFGISKLLEQEEAPGPQETLSAAHAFTPDFASPEQLRGEPSGAGSDIFSLGVVFYQLLCGSLPHAPRARRGLADEPAMYVDPSPPSALTGNRALARVVRGDLDTIVLKALKGSAAERYPTMEALAQDLERYQRGEPVLAQRDSAGYRLRKFAQRNRQMLQAVAAAVGVTGAVFTGLAIHQAREADVTAARAVELSADAMARRGVPRAASIRDVVGYREYLLARSLMPRPTEANLREILRLAESATTRNPDFAHGYALLAGANVLFLDIGYANPGAFTIAEPAARRALVLEPRLAAAYATLGSIAAHRGDWLGAAEHFALALELNDQNGRIRARHAQVLLASAGMTEKALEEFQAEFRLTPTHARGSMQIATALSLFPGQDAEALKYADIALSLGWPHDEADVQNLYAHTARRAGRDAEAAEYQSLALSPAAVAAGADLPFVRKLYAALRTPPLRPAALRELDAIDARIESANTGSFGALMFSMQWHTLLGDLEGAHARAASWLELSARTGLSGIPHNGGFWLPEMRPFRAHPRFEALAEGMGLMRYWRKFGPPDGCELRARLVCGNS
jgi:tetratricopeptide (TPR) repeat protein